MVDIDGGYNIKPIMCGFQLIKQVWLIIHLSKLSAVYTHETLFQNPEYPPLLALSMEAVQREERV